MHRRPQWCSGIGRSLGILAAAAALVACESPLKLEGVEARAQTPIRRSDTFQKAASSRGTLVVVGNHGLVLRSTDAGATWSRQELAGWPSLIDLAACADGRLAALAAENQILVSHDGGQSWKAHALSTEEAPQGIACDPGGRLWVVGGFSTITVSADDGETWDDRSVGEDTIFTTIQFIDERNAVVFGEFGANVRSSDGGETWTRGAPLPGDFYAQDAWFADRDTGWVAGLAGQILHTVDGGASWTLQQAPLPVPIYAIEGAGGGRVYAVGGEGVLLREDAGRWTRIEHGRPIRLLLRVLQPLDAQRLLIGGAAGALDVVTAEG